MDYALLALIGFGFAFTINSIARERNLRRTELEEALLCIDDLQARVKALEEKE